MNKRHLQQLVKEQRVIKRPGNKQATFRALAKSFLIHLAPKVEADGSCFDSHENIMDAIECSHPTLKKIIEYWCEEGIVTYVKGWRNKKVTKASVYQFNETAMQERKKTQQAWFDTQKKAAKAARGKRAEAPMIGNSGSETLSVSVPTASSPLNPSARQANSEVAVKPLAFQCQTSQPERLQQLSQNGAEGGSETYSVSVPTEVAVKPMALYTSTYGTRVETLQTQITLHNTVPDENLFSEGQELGPQAKPTLAIQMPASTFETTPARPRLSKPRMTLEQAGRILKAFESSAVDFICADCLSSDTVKDGHCTRDDMGSTCGSTNLVSRPSRFDWFKELEAQWAAYRKQRLSGLSLKDIIGTLDAPSMEKQPEIIKCRDKAETMSIAERRTWAKELYDDAGNLLNRLKGREAWYLYACGLLDDDAEEPEPWVKQLFDDLEALKPRPRNKALTFAVPVAGSIAKEQETRQ